MFLDLKKINNESGVVLFFVLITIIIMMIVCASILSQSINEVNFTQQQIDEIETDQLVKGIFWNSYASNSFSNYPNNINLNNRNYTFNISNSTDGGAINYTVSGNYDSFS